MFELVVGHFGAHVGNAHIAITLFIWAVVGAVFGRDDVQNMDRVLYDAHDAVDEFFIQRGSVNSG